MNKKFMSTIVVAIMLLSVIPMSPMGPAVMKAFASPGPVLSLSVSLGYVGGTITVTGTGFPAALEVGLTWDGPATQLTGTRPSITGPTNGTTVKTDANGWFKVQAVIPAAAKGDHTVDARGVGLASSVDPAPVTFTVNPKITMNVPSGYVGDSPQYTLTGFKASEACSIKFVAGTTYTWVASVTPGATGGSGPTGVALPDMFGDIYTVTASSATVGNTASTSFTVLSKLFIRDSADTLDVISMQRSAPQTLYLKGTGFPNAAITSLKIVKGATEVSAAAFASFTPTNGKWPASGVTAFQWLSDISFVGVADLVFNPTFTNAIIVSVPTVATYGGVLELSATSGTVGSSLTLYGSGLQASEASLKWTLDGVLKDALTVDVNGAFSYPITSFPATTKGAHSIDIMTLDESARLIFDLPLPITFTVNSKVTLGSTTLTKGDTPTATGSGYYYGATTVINTADSATGWDSAAWDDTFTVALDTTKRMEGTGSIKGTEAATILNQKCMLRYQPTPALDLSAKKIIRFWFRSDKANTIWTAAFLLLNSSATDFKGWTLGTWSANTWTLKTIDTSGAAGETGGTLDFAAVTMIGLRFTNDGTSEAVIVWVDYVLALSTTGESISGKADSVTWNPSGATTVDTVGAWTVAMNAFPDVAAGTAFNATGTSAGNWATLTITVKPLVDAGFLNPTNGVIGATVTVTTAKIHGLKASTQYQVKWDQTSTIVTTFTSSATGDLAASVTFAVPAGAAAGDHIADVIEQATGLSAIYGVIVATTGQYANMLFTVTAGNFAIYVTQVHCGDKIAATANGLTASTANYKLYFDKGAGYESFDAFTSTSSGTIPSTATLTIPTAEGAWPIGKTYGVQLWTPAPAQIVPTINVVLYPKILTNATSGLPGSTFLVNGTGFKPNTTVKILFGGNLQVNPAITGTVVGTVVTSAAGVIGNSPVIVPSVAYATYYVDIWYDVAADGIQAYGESSLLAGDRVSFTVGAAPAATAGDIANKVLAGGTTLKYLYPSTSSTNKLPGVGPAAPSDVYAASGALQGAGGYGYVQAWDTSASAVDLTTGRPQLVWATSGSYIVMTSGPAVHNSIKYYMDLAPSGADQSPAFFRTATISGVLYYQFVLRAGNSTIVTVPASDVAGLQRDICLIQGFTDASGRVIFIITGLNAPGTQAGAIWFVKNVMANPSLYSGSVYVIGWNDTATAWTNAGVTATGNNNTFVDYPGEIQKIYP